MQSTSSRSARCSSARGRPIAGPVASAMPWRRAGARSRASVARTCGVSEPALSAGTGPRPRTARVSTRAASGAETAVGTCPSSRANSAASAAGSSPESTELSPVSRASSPIRAVSVGSGSPAAWSVAQRAAAVRAAGGRVMCSASAVTARAPTPPAVSPLPRTVSRNSSGRPAVQIRAQTSAQMSVTGSPAARPVPSCTRNRWSCPTGSDEGSAPTICWRACCGRRVYVVKVSRCACSRGRTVQASAIHWATSALSRSTSTICRASLPSASVRRSAKNAASRSARDRANATSPSRRSSPDGSNRSIGSGRPPGGVASAQRGDSHAVIGSAPSGSRVPGGRRTAWAWKLPQRPL